MRLVALAGVLASTTILSGCAGTVAGVSLSSISSFAGFASTLFTGADLGEHAVSLVTGKDCRFSEGLVRGDRDICEERGSAATRADFHGIFVDRIEEDGTVVYAAPKYMSASIGAGENENDPSAIWAAIKAEKAKEDTERQLARANAAQQIDVAALATETVSSESLAFLPQSTNEIVDGDTASQTAQRSRPVVNAAASKPAPVRSTADDQAVIDATTFAAATPTDGGASVGEGGPLIATATSTVPVTSKLIRGEPVVILRLRPAMTASSVAPVDTAMAMPSDLPVSEFAPATTQVKLAATPAAQPRSPQNIITDVPTRPSFPATPARATTSAKIEPAALATPAKPRTAKPAEKWVTEDTLATPAVSKPATAKPAASKPATLAAATTKPTPAATPAPRKPAPTAAYEPAEDAAYAGSVPVQTPADIHEPPAPQESAAAFSQPDAAPVAPSPLIPMQQE